MNEQTQRAPHDGLDTVFDAIRNLGFRRRTRGNRWLGGVCAGVADRFNVDPVVVRAAFVLLGVLAGIGVTAYLVAWLLMPDSDGVSAAEKALRHGDGSSIVLLVVTAIAVFSGPWWFTSNGVGRFPWGLLLVGGFIWWMRAHRHAAGTHGQQPADLAGASTPSAGPHTPGASSTPGGPSGSATPVWPDGPSSPAPSYAPTASSTALLRRRSGGLLMTLLGIGAALVAYGVTRWTGDVLGFSGDHRVVALAASLAVLGVVLVVLGVAGWRAGFLGFLALVLAVLTLAAGSVANVHRFGGRVGEQVWRPTSAASSTTYQLLVGQGRLNLTDLPPQSGTKAGSAPVALPVSVGVGELDVVVPNNLTVRIDSHVGLGAVTAPGDDARSDGDGGTGGTGSDISRSVTVGSGPPQLVVDAQVLVGQVNIMKES